MKIFARLSVLIVLALAFGLMGSSLFPRLTVFGFTSAPSPAESVGQLIALVLATLLGVWSRTIQEHLQAAARGPVRTVLAKSLFRREFWGATVVSPLLFFVTYRLAKDVPDTLTAILLAYQNGFFWRTVLKSAQASDDPVSSSGA